MQRLNLSRRQRQHTPFTSFSFSFGCLLAYSLTFQTVWSQNAWSQTTGQLVDKQSQTTSQAQASQKRVDKLSDESRALSQSYRLAVEKTERLKQYNDHVATLLTSQTKELESLQTQIAGIRTTQQDIIPLMRRMLDTLVAFVRADTPFLEQERSQRIESLQHMLKQADVSVSEKFRRVLEAYQIENEYGRTVEAYQGDMLDDGKTRTVNFLRFGRIALIYQTLDGQESKVWNRATQSWQKLPDSYRTSIRKGLAIARKQQAPDLIHIPVQFDGGASS